ncbi:hypothetical protein V8C35DRAFT_6535 [Trichoderma chlorosporum]
MKCPFIKTTWIDGSPLIWKDSFRPQPLRHALLGRIASIQLSLITCTPAERL